MAAFLILTTAFQIPPLPLSRDSESADAADKPPHTFRAVELRDVCLIALHRQAHTAKAEILFDPFRNSFLEPGATPVDEQLHLSVH